MINLFYKIQNLLSVDPIKPIKYLILKKWTLIILRNETNKDEMKNWNFLNFLLNQSLPNTDNPWSLENIEFLVELNIPGRKAHKY